MTPARRRGATVVEFAFTLPILILLLAGVVDWGAYMSLKTSIARATADGARRGAAVFEPLGTPQGSLTVPAAEARTRLVLDEMGLGCPSGCWVEAQFCERDEGGPCGEPPLDTLLLRVTFPFQPLFGLASTPATIRERSQFVLEIQ